VREVLSSKMTHFYRYVWPAAWLASLIVLALLIVTGQWHLPPAAYVILAVACVVLAAHYLLVLRRLPWVVATDDGLLISEHRRDVLVPWSNVARMRGSRWSRHGMIIVELRSPMSLGGRVTFLPYLKMWLPMWREHPAARVIQERAGLVA
jgi:hypothetical protein